MEDAKNRTAGLGQAALDREMQLVREAIAMVAGAAPDGSSSRALASATSFSGLAVGWLSRRVFD